MKLKSVSCTQFAGVRDRNVSFTDGINVIYGKNESGKSTLVNLISRTLFQDVKLNMSTKEGKYFRELYYPSARKGGGFISSSAVLVFPVPISMYRAPIFRCFSFSTACS